MLIKQISQCRDINSLHDFCQKLDSEEVQFNGNSYVNIKTGDKLDAVKLTNRIIDLYNKFSIKEKTNTAKETAALLFDLRKITANRSTSKLVFRNTFGKHATLGKLTKHCQEAVRQDAKVMSTVVDNYNLLAWEVNQEIRNKEVVASHLTEEKLSQDIKKLEFLNEFIGLTWDKRQREGVRPVPLCGSGHVISAAPPSSRQPEDCKSLAELYGLVQSLREQTTIVKGGETIETPGEGKISVDALVKKMRDLFKKEMRKDPYVKSDVYFQYAATAFALDKVVPGATKRKGIAADLQTSIDGIRSDPAAIEKVQKHYNVVAGKINEDLRWSITRDSAVWSNLSRQGFLTNRDQALKTLEQIEFLNLFAGFKLDREHFEGKAVFPVFIDTSNRQEKRKAQFNYNFMAMMCNYELGCASKHDRLAELKHRIDPKNLTSALLDELEEAAIREEIGLLESYIELTARPLPKRFMQNLRKECCRMGEILEIQLSKEQKKGLKPFPIFGRELAVSVDESRQFATAVPFRLQNYNRVAQQVNAQLEYIGRGLDYLELHRKYNEKDMVEGMKELEETLPVLEQLEREWLAVEKDNPGFFNSDRMAKSRLAWLLLDVAELEYITLTTKQKRGTEMLPVLSVEELPFPGVEKVLEELNKIPEEKRSAVYQAWPQSWKEAMSTVPQLKIVEDTKYDWDNL